MPLPTTSHHRLRTHPDRHLCGYQTSSTWTCNMQRLRLLLQSTKSFTARFHRCKPTSDLYHTLLATGQVPHLPRFPVQDGPPRRHAASASSLLISRHAIPCFRVGAFCDLQHRHAVVSMVARRSMAYASAIVGWICQATRTRHFCDAQSVLRTDLRPTSLFLARQTLRYGTGRKFLERLRKLLRGNATAVL